MIKGVLLDVDGTLVLSNDAHARSWVDAFRSHGVEVTFAQVRPLIGMGGDKIIPHLVRGLSSKEGEGRAISTARGEIFRESYAVDLQPTPGSRELVEYLQAKGLRLVVASSAKEDELRILLKAAGVDDLLEEATTSSDADKSKPDPDIIQVALQKMQLPADQVIMLGDSPYDIEAAGRAGVGCIALRCGGWKDVDLAGALAIYRDPADLLEHYHTSPLTK
jgi:HAD superfamily hydrolase (TIGR01509 family)